MNTCRKMRTIAFTLLPALLLTTCNLPTPAVTPGAAPATAEPAASAEPAESCVRSETGSLQLCLFGAAEGSMIAAAPGVPVRLAAEASGAVVVGISISAAPGDTVLHQENSAGADPFRAEFSWTPALGAGGYTLRLETMTGDKSEFVVFSVAVTVTGLPSVTPTPGLAPGEVPADVRAKVLEAYRTAFGIQPVAPVIARKFRSGVEDPWVSTVYAADTLYEVDIYPDRQVETWTTPIFPNIDVKYKESLFKDPLCKPAGTYSMLVVFLDFGNISVGKDEVLADLAAATTEVNAAYAAYPSSPSDPTPILQIRTTGLFLPVPADVKGEMITPDQIRQYTGADPAAFQWIAQVDLDAQSTYRFADGGRPETTSFGYAFTGCPAVRSMINIQITVDAKEQLSGIDNRLAETMLAHEVFHLFGYPGSHIWPCIRGTESDPADCCGMGNIPALLLGWTDADGDGAPEILDPTPYGMTLA